MCWPLLTIRAGVNAGLTEWKNRKNNGMVDAVVQSLADVTISHFNSRLEAVNEAIAQTIDNVSGLQHTAVRRLVRSWRERTCRG
jgi:hypothetical protein